MRQRIHRDTSLDYFLMPEVDSDHGTAPLDLTEEEYEDYERTMAAYYAWQERMATVQKAHEARLRKEYHEAQSGRAGRPPHR